MVFGFGNLIDKTKPEVQVNPGDKSIVVFFESKFTGIITLESKDVGEEKKPSTPNVNVVRNYCKSNDIKNLTYDEENDKLIIEYKQDKPNKEITDLSGELAEIKKADSYQALFTAQSKMIESKLNSEVQEKNHAQTLNYVLGAISLGSLLILAWVLINGTKSNLLGIKSKKEKD